MQKGRPLRPSDEAHAMEKAAEEFVMPAKRLTALTR
jgi:hypothetical protein